MYYCPLSHHLNMMSKTKNGIVDYGSLYVSSFTGFALSCSLATATIRFSTPDNPRDYVFRIFLLKTNLIEIKNVSLGIEHGTLVFFLLLFFFFWTFFRSNAFSPCVEAIRSEIPAGLLKQQKKISSLVSVFSTIYTLYKYTSCIRIFYHCCIWPTIIHPNCL